MDCVPTGFQLIPHVEERKPASLLDSLVLVPQIFAYIPKTQVKEQKLVPVIKPNRRNTKEPTAIARMYRWFNKKHYKERYKVERTFGWQDTYRRLAISYDRLEEIRLGFRHLAYAMINFRVTFNTS